LKSNGKETKERQVHDKTAPGETLGERIPQASNGQAREIAAKKHETHRQFFPA